MSTLALKESACQEDPASAQIPLPTGPVGLVRPRRERTDEDKAWYSRQVKVGEDIPNVHYREVYRQMAFHGSCNPGRLCFAAHSTIADAKGISPKTVQRAVRHLEKEGFLRCVSVGAGRETGKYLVLGRSESPSSVDSEYTLHGLSVHEIEKGIDLKSKDLSFKAEAKSRDPVPTHTEGLKKAVILTTFPSRKQNKKTRQYRKSRKLKRSTQLHLVSLHSHIRGKLRCCSSSNGNSATKRTTNKPSYSTAWSTPTKKESSTV